MSKLLFEENLKVQQVLHVSLSIETVKLHQDTMESSLFMGDQFS